MDTKPLVAIVIVTWNSVRDIKECLESLMHQDYANYKVIVVDNDSHDETVSLVQSFPEVILLEQEHNLYFAAGNNVGMQHAMDNLNAQYIGVLNPDTIVEKNWISSQVEVLASSEKIGAVGPKIVFAATPEVINSAGLERGGFLYPYDRGYGQEDAGQFDEQLEVFGVTGTSILFKAEMLKDVGLFNEGMQMYLEEAELFTRAEKHGWKVIYTPMTKVLHKHMQSTGQQPSNFYVLHARRNYLVLVGKHYGFRKFLRALSVNFHELSFINFIRTTLAALVILIFK